MNRNEREKEELRHLVESLVHVVAGHSQPLLMNTEACGWAWSVQGGLLRASSAPSRPLTVWLPTQSDGVGGGITHPLAFRRFAICAVSRHWHFIVGDRTSISPRNGANRKSLAIFPYQPHAYPPSANARELRSRRYAGCRAPAVTSDSQQSTRVPPTSRSPGTARSRRPTFHRTARRFTSSAADEEGRMGIVPSELRSGQSSEVLRSNSR